MVFSSVFDRSLWLMLLASDDINREKILYFINEVPDNVYDDIKKMIDDNAHLCHMNHHMSSLEFWNTLKDDKDYNCFFKYRLSFGHLDISFSRYNEELNMCESFGLSLNSIDSKYLSNPLAFSSVELGKFKWSLDKFDYHVDSSVKRQSDDTWYRMKASSNSKAMIVSCDLKNKFKSMKVNISEVLFDGLNRDDLVSLVNNKKKRSRRK